MVMLAHWQDWFGYRIKEKAELDFGEGKSVGSQHSPTVVHSYFIHYCWFIYEFIYYYVLNFYLMPGTEDTTVNQMVLYPVFMLLMD